MSRFIPLCGEIMITKLNSSQKRIEKIYVFLIEGKPFLHALGQCTSNLKAIELPSDIVVAHKTAHNTVQG